MLLSLVKLDAGRDSLLQERLVHALSLVGRNDLVFDTLQKQDWATQSVNTLDGRARFVQCLFLGILADEAIEVSTFKFVRIASQHAKVANSVERSSSCKGVAEGKCAQSRVAAGTPAVDTKSLGIRQALIDEILGSVANVVNINNAPRSSQPATVVTTIASRAAIIDIEDCKAATGPILNASVETRTSTRRRPTVGLDKKGRGVVRGALVLSIGWRIVITESGAESCGEFDLLGNRNNIIIEFESGRAGKLLRFTLGFERPLEYA